jgi:hypothetical protein
VSGAPAPDGPAGDTLGQAFCRENLGTFLSDAPREPGRRVLRRLALRVLVVLLLLAAGDLVVRRLVPPESLLPWMDREFASYTVKLDRFEHAPAPDLLFLGNSRVHDGIVPSIFADALQQSWGRPARVFNLGLMNAKAAELAAVARGHLPDPPPKRIVIGISGTEFTNVAEFQYASRFLWSGSEFCDYLRRTPASRLEREHIENWLGASIGKAWYCFAERDALQLALESRVRELFGQPDQNRNVRLRISRYNRLDALSADGTSNEGLPQPNLAAMLAQGDDVRIPPYSLGDTSEITRGADYPLMRAVLTELAARGCRVALVEVPPSPWLQEQAPEFHGDLFRQRMAEFAGSLGIPFVPMPPSATFLGNDAYVDANHLNRNGAERFSTILVKRLADTGFFEG